MKRKTREGDSTMLRSRIHRWQMAARLGGVVALLFVNGCASSSSTPIKTLLDDPSRFDGKDVRIEGTVEDAVGALGLGTYEIDDGTASIRVVSDDGAPRVGSHVGVVGTFQSAFTVGDESLAVLQEESRYAK